MYKKLQFIALVSNTRPESPGYTLYFFAKEEKIVLPVAVTSQEILYLLGEVDKLSHRQDIYQSLIRIVLGLGAKIISVSVYKYCDEEFYTYLNLLRDGEKLEISLKFVDAVKIAKKADIPIFIKEDILSEQGIKVSKQILRDALNEG